MTPTGQECGSWAVLRHPWSVIVFRLSVDRDREPWTVTVAVTVASSVRGNHVRQRTQLQIWSIAVVTRGA